ncbi:hypothetical protein [Yoonia sediminilitoris]|uniref:Acid stress chaperone HdeA n=1 Tax=Yoonia sediminilitoris TaxID=1286148 RepID=A0A2T6K8Q7_9RHOB|nr:hypothetical protein [Yoonia sediminilitoris]PUB11100.1 hypothetical protein C8N45_11584 [Yoonia sediminilitoris]RCW91019.1 hypothetical protein DFP92_11584 [Yoonia sediminilitoris]
MKKILVTTFATVIGLSGMALAGEPQGQASGQGCFNTTAGDQDNPGKLFQAFKNGEGPAAFEGLNPKEIAELAIDIPSGKVSDIIKLVCDNTPS